MCYNSGPLTAESVLRVHAGLNDIVDSRRGWPCSSQCVGAAGCRGRHDHLSTLRILAIGPGTTVSNDYHVPDGPPRYGNRADTAGERSRSGAAVRVEEAAEDAARLSLDDMPAAIDRRLESAWAEVPDPSVTELRKDHSEELAARVPS